jgi:hypothetical protein
MELMLLDRVNEAIEKERKVSPFSNIIPKGEKARREILL